jgi:hypothetical protein
VPEATRRACAAGNPRWQEQLAHLQTFNYSDLQTSRHPIVQLYLNLHICDIPSFIFLFVSRPISRDIQLRRKSESRLPASFLTPSHCSCL